MHSIRVYQFGPSTVLTVEDTPESAAADSFGLTTSREMFHLFAAFNQEGSQHE
jgi:hypothetical protein